MVTIEKEAFCWNSRKWLNIPVILPKNCPHKHEAGGVYDCIGPDCAYYEERELTKYAKKKKALVGVLAGRATER